MSASSVNLGVIFGAVRLQLDQLQADIAAAKDLFSGLRDQLAMAFDGINPVQPLEDAVAALPDATAPALSETAEAAAAASEEIGTAAEAAAEQTQSAAEEMAASESDAATEAEDSGSRIGSAWGMVADKLSGIAGSIGETFGRIQESGNQLRESLSSVGEHLDGLGDKFKEGLSHATEFATGMLEFQALAGTTNAIGEFASSMIGMNEQFETLHQQLASITGSSGQATQIIDWVKQFGQQVPDTTEHLAEAVVTIQSLGLNAEQVVPSIANVAAAMGTDLPTAAQAFSDAFEGRFQMMQMELHVTKSQLEDFGLKISKTGKVDSASLVAAFEKLSQTKFGHAIANQMQTLRGQLSNLQDRIQFFAMSLGKPLFDLAKQGLGQIFAFLDAHQAQINAFADVVGGGLVTALRAVGTAAQASFGFVSRIFSFIASHAFALHAVQFALASLGAGLVVFALTQIPVAIGALSGLAAAAIAAVAPLVVAAAPFIAIGAAIVGVGLAFKLAYGHIKPFHDAVQGLLGVLGGLFDHVKQVSEPFQTFRMVTETVNGHLVHVRVAVDGVRTALVHVKGALDPVLNLFHGVADGAGRVAGALGALLPHQQKVTEHYTAWKTVLEHVNGHLVRHKEAVDGTRTVLASFPGILPQIQGGFADVGRAVGTVLSFLRPLWTTLVAQLHPIFVTLASTIQTTLLPAWRSIQGSVQQLMPTLSALGTLLKGALAQAWVALQPVLKVIGALIGGSIVIDIGFLIGALQGLIAGLAQVLMGAIKFGAGLIQAIAGALQIVLSVVRGVVTILADILTGHWSKIGSDAKAAWSGIVSGVKNLVQGLWTAIQGIFQGSIGAVFSFLTNFVSGVIGFFQHLFETLVGHSIVPDLINGIVGFFAGLPGKVLGHIGALVSGAIGGFAKLATGALAHVTHLVSGTVNGAKTLATTALKHVTDFTHGALTGAAQLAIGWAAHLVALTHTTSQQTALARDEAAIHAGEMKVKVLEQTAAMHLHAAAQAEQMRQSILAQIAATKDPAKKHALELKLAVVTEAEDMHRQAAQHAEQMAKETEAHLQQLAADAKTHAQHLHDNFLGPVGALVSGVVTQFQSVVTQAGAILGGLATSALSWGANLASNLANGIKNGIGAVGSAVSGVADKIKNFLGFHSPAKEGPGAEADQWAPNFMRMFAAGVTAGTPGLLTAAQRAAAMLRAGLTGSAAGGSPALAGVAGSAGALGGAGAGGLAGNPAAGAVHHHHETTLYLTVEVTADSDDDDDNATEQTPEAVGTRFGTALGQALDLTLAKHNHH